MIKYNLTNWEHFFKNDLFDWELKSDFESYVLFNQNNTSNFETPNKSEIYKTNNENTLTINEFIFKNLKLFFDDTVLLEYLDFAEKHIIKEIDSKDILNNWDYKKESLFNFFVTNFNYNSDYGFHLFNNKKFEITYFYGEDFNLKDINWENRFRSFHLFIVSKVCSPIFQDEILKYFSIDSFMHDTKFSFSFGEKIFELKYNDRL